MRDRFLKYAILFLIVALPLHASRDRHTAQAHASAATGSNPAQYPENLVEGHGAPRTSYTDCVAGLPNLARELAARGIKPTETPTCLPVAGDVENYSARFRAWAPQKMAFREVAGGTYNSEAICDSVAQNMRAEIQKTQKVLETGCTGTKSDQSASASILYQPVAIVVDTN